MSKIEIIEISEWGSEDWGPFSSKKEAKKEARKMAEEAHHSTNFFLVLDGVQEDEILVSGKLTTLEMQSRGLID